MTQQQPPPPPAPGATPPWQQPMPRAQQAAPAKPGLRTRWWFLAAIALVALLIGVGIGGSGSSTSAKSLPAVTTTATATATVQVTTTPTQVVATHTATVRVTYTPPPVDETGDGQYLVGREIKPGTWHTDGGDGCYYELDHDLSGGFGSIITNDNISGPTTIQIRPSVGAVKFSGGCKWSRIG